MTRYRRTPQFRRDLERLPDAVQKKVAKAFMLFRSNPAHPSLEVKRIKGTRAEIWEGRVDIFYRFTFHYEEDVIVFRRIGPHSVVDEDARNG